MSTTTTTRPSDKNRNAPRNAHKRPHANAIESVVARVVCKATVEQLLDDDGARVVCRRRVAPAGKRNHVFVVESVNKVRNRRRRCNEAAHALNARQAAAQLRTTKTFSRRPTNKHNSEKSHRILDCFGWITRANVHVEIRTRRNVAKLSVEREVALRADCV